MKFEIRSKEKDKLNSLLKTFVEESKKEYERQIGQIAIGPAKKMVPIFDTDYFYDKEKDRFIIWNTFDIPDIMKKFSFLNPFSKAISKMNNNLESYLKANGIKDASVKLISKI